MRFVLLIAFLALIAGVFMEHKHEKHVKHHKHLKKYFHKKMCYCLKEHKGICKVLKCCDVYQQVPYKVLIKVCKYGKCKFMKKHYKKHSKKHIHKKEKFAGVKKPQGQPSTLQLIQFLSPHSF
eukprot:TRINITY_DN869_c0_g4_i1.p4 TRINITY_DN869_c0_g4~~TRINITY_DN869_c0_g4_i1.p4  ORF type:complete len:123 (-),score=10.68 TRINITY_DN869_c0_g4_i1:523-891(-)